jgi:hypothetical protein
MTAIPTKLFEAFEIIRLGKVNEGVKLFDKVDGFDEVKAIALAELAYFRHDWKNGISFTQDIFLCEKNLVYNKSYHRLYAIDWYFELYLLATCKLDCWKESRDFWKKIKKNENLYVPDRRSRIDNIIAQISDQQNTTTRLLKSKPKLRTTGKEDILEKSERTLQSHHNKSKHSLWRWNYDSIADDIYCEGKTEDFITFYKKYSDHFENSKTFLNAAKSYIAMDNIPESKNAIRQYIRYWQYSEPHQVEPIVLFADPELWSVMSDSHFTTSLLSIPHN